MTDNNYQWSLDDLFTDKDVVEKHHVEIIIHLRFPILNHLLLRYFMCDNVTTSILLHYLTVL